MESEVNLDQFQSWGLVSSPAFASAEEATLWMVEMEKDEDFIRFQPAIWGRRAYESLPEDRRPIIGGNCLRLMAGIDFQAGVIVETIYGRYPVSYPGENGDVYVVLLVANFHCTQIELDRRAEFVWVAREFSDIKSAYDWAESPVGQSDRFKPAAVGGAAVAALLGIRFLPYQSELEAVNLEAGVVAVRSNMFDGSLGVFYINNPDGSVTAIANVDINYAELTEFEPQTDIPPTGVTDAGSTPTAADLAHAISIIEDLD